MSLRPAARCPACEREVPDGALECPSCGVIFAKFRGHFAPPYDSHAGRAHQETARRKTSGTSVPWARIIFTLVGLAVGRYAYQRYSEYRLTEDLTRQVDELQMQGPGAAQQRANENLASASAENRPKAAASQFLGYYFLTTRGYGAYCQKQAVDIAPFVSVFANAHTAEHDRATSILSQGGITEDKLWSVSEPAIHKAVANEMATAFRNSGTPGTAICQALRDNANDVIGEMRFSVVNPAAHKILMSASASP